MPRKTTRKTPKKATRKGSAKGGPKVNSNIDRRRREIERMMALQVPHRDIARHIATEFGTSERQIYYDLQAIYKRMEAEGKREAPMERQVMKRSLRDFYQRAMKAGQFAAALQALDRLCKMGGFSVPS